jgi:hypothetical protein
MPAQPTGIAYRRNLGLAVLGVDQQLRPLRKRQAALLEIVMAIISAFDTTELVTQAPFGHFTPHAERGKVRIPVDRDR